MFDYRNDRFGAICLQEAAKSKGDIGFGAVFVVDGKIRGRGRNRTPTREERRLFKKAGISVDYSAHAEQFCVLEPLLRGIDISNGEIFVVGMVLIGRKKGRLTTRKGAFFACKKCVRTVISPHGVPVNVPHVNGWVKLLPEIAAATSEELCGRGFWRKFAGARKR